MPRDALSQPPGLDQQTDFDIPFVGSFREVGRTDEHDVSVDDHTLCVQGSPFPWGFVQREGEIVYLRQRTALGPFIAPESLAEPVDHFRCAGRVTSRAPDI